MPRSQCAERFERLVRRAAEAATVVCPECNSGTVEKLTSAFALGKAQEADGAAELLWLR